MLVDPRQSDPLTQLAGDFCVGALNAHYIGTFLAHPVIVGADVQVDGIASDAGGDIEALGDVAVLGIALNASVAIGAGTGDGNALAHLNQGRAAFAGLYLLHAAFAVGGAVVNDAGAAAVVLEVAVVVVDADQQASRGSVQLSEQAAQAVDLFGAGVDDQFVFKGADRAVLAEEGLRGGEQFGAGAMVQRQDFGGGQRSEAERQKQRGEKGA
ncbi:hypothetical protein D3C77_171860 [compost metagenome]